MLKVQTGDYDTNTTTWQGCLFPRTAELTDDHKSLTLTDFALKLAEEMGLSVGEIQLISIDFKFREPKTDDEK